MEISQEQQLIAATLTGQDGYEQLVERYHVGLIIHAERLLGNRQDAEDVAQEAFVKAYLSLSSYDAKQSRFSTWLYKIATNLAIDHLRKNKQKFSQTDVELLAEDTMPSMIDLEARRELCDLVKGLMPPEYRQVIEAYYWEGKSYQQIAEQQAVPVNTVRTWTRRAKLQLKVQLS